MKVTGQKSLPTIGFLTVLEHHTLGVTGGLLVTHPHGRPVEFHCTAPVKPDRGQQILYGPTLVPFLYGEQIARTLLEQISVQPYLVLTDLEPVLAVRPFVRFPVTMLVEERRPLPANDSDDQMVWQSDPAHRRISPPVSARLLRFEAGPQPLAVSVAHRNDRPQVLAHWESCLGQMDPFEPLERIREAINEAQRAA